MVSHVVLGHLVVPDLVLLSLLIHCCGEFVEIVVGIHVCPKRLTVSRISASTISLFIAVVPVWNTRSEEHISKCILESFFVVALAEESCLVVVINKCSKDISILKSTLLLIDLILKNIERVTISEDCSEGVLEREVKEGVHMVLIVSNEANIAVEALTNLEDTWS